MKVNAEHLETMRKLIALLDTNGRRRRYVARDFPRADAVKDLDRRYRWDLFYAAKLYSVTEDYSTEHIDTALRRIVPVLDRTPGAYS